MMPESSSAGLNFSTNRPPKLPFLAIPVASEFMALGGIHRGDELESVEGLASGIHFLENDTDSFLRRAGTKGDDGHLIPDEIIKDVLFELTDDVPFLVEVAFPHRIFNELLLPIVPLEGHRYWIHQ